jgi:lipid A oxidase
MPRYLFPSLSLSLILPALAPQSARADIELSIYIGAQTAPQSRVEGTDTLGSFSFLAQWDGKSAAKPPYYGLRATWYQTRNIGYGFELNHAKVYASDDTLTASGFDTLEFTDGLNIITANVFYRWPDRGAQGRLTPYVGAGAGISVPHVEVKRGVPKTFDYQLTGPAATWVAGVSYDINETWALFAEYKGTYSMNKADLTGGGTLSTDIVTNAVNLGLTYTF